MLSKVPDNVEVLGNLGLAYMAKKDLDKARQSFEQLLTLQPENTLGLLNLIRIEGAGGKNTQELITRVQEQIEKAPESAGNLILLGTMLLGEKQYNAALEAIKKAQKLAPQNPRTYSLSASILNKQHKAEAAITEYKDLLKQDPQSVQAHMGIGALLEQKGDTAGARAEYEKVLVLQPDFAPAANNLSWIIAEETQPDLGEALRLAMIAKEQLPDEVHIIDTLGWVHYKRESYSLARNEFAQAVEKQPDMPVFRYHLALALHGENKTDQAIKELEETLSSKADFAERNDAETLLKKWKNNYDR
jgi:tetratricopeptide (TPR) repeat protein